MDHHGKIVVIITVVVLIVRTDQVWHIIITVAVLFVMTNSVFARIVISLALTVLGVIQRDAETFMESCSFVRSP